MVTRRMRAAPFIGAFPMNDPHYAILVMVDEPKPNATSYGFANRRLGRCARSRRRRRAHRAADGLDADS